MWKLMRPSKNKERTEKASKTRFIQCGSDHNSESMTGRNLEGDLFRRPDHMSSIWFSRLVD